MKAACLFSISLVSFACAKLPNTQGVFAPQQVNNLQLENREEFGPNVLDLRKEFDADVVQAEIGSGTYEYVVYPSDMECSFFQKTSLFRNGIGFFMCNARNIQGKNFSLGTPLIAVYSVDEVKKFKNSLGGGIIKLRFLRKDSAGNYFEFQP